MDGALAPGAWSESVRLAPDERLREVLRRGLSAPSPPTPVWVTDLIDLRPAYWRRVTPTAPSEERRARRQAGEDLHLRIGRLLGPAQAREVRRQRDGVVARVDLLGARVTEFKTTTWSGPTASAPVRESYLDQLALYCGLLDRSEARLIVLAPTSAPGERPRAAVFDIEYPTPAEIWTAAQARAERLREAWTRAAPTALPRCAWRGRGCEFQDAGACDCEGTEAPDEAAPFGTRPEAVPNSPASEELEAALEAAPPAPEVRRFRELVYPRRGFYERQDPAAVVPWSPPPATEPDLWRRLTELLERGEAGEVGALDPTPPGPAERVPTLDGLPYLLRTSRARSAVPTAAVRERQPQYLIELALRCGAVGAREGRLIVGYERLPEGPDRVTAFRVWFDPGVEPSRLLAERSEALLTATRDGDPARLPTCPGWMYEECPYRSGCGCGGVAARDQR